MSVFLSGSAEDIHKEILLKLNDKDLANICQTNKQAEKICNNDQFWNLRIQKVYEADLSKYTNDKTYKEIYRELIEDDGTEYRNAIDKVFTRACNLGYLPVVKYFIELERKHIDINTGLLEASENGHLSVVQYLIEREEDPDDIDFSEALIGASRKGHLPVVKYFIEKGADVHIDDDYALTSASEEGHLSVVKYLIENGADVHAGEYHDTALILASAANHLHIVKYLIEEGGADIHSEYDEIVRLASGYIIQSLKDFIYIDP